MWATGPQPDAMNERIGRQPRGLRRRGTILQLTARDQELLLALARFRVARTSDLVALCFPGVRKDTAAVRLRRSFDAGYLDVRAFERSEESVYAVGAKGRAWLQSQSVESGPVPRGGLDHHLAIVRTWVALATGLTGVQLERALPDWEVREGSTGARLIPDLLAVLRVRESVISLAVEVDLGTERLQEIRSKVRRYGEVLMDGGTELVLGVVTRSSVRAGHVQSLLKAEYAGASMVWCESEGPARAFGEFFAPLTNSPYGKGRAVSPNDDGSMLRDGDDAGL
jgi:protein involved in plasmid replication-relaxation